MTSQLKSTRTKVLASVGLLGAVAAVAGLGTFGTFTSTTSSSQQVTSGTVVIALGAANTATNRLTVPVAGMVPGDTMQRQVQLSNTGNQALATLTLATTVGAPSTLLDSDATNGLQLTVQACTVPWTEGGTAPAYTYVCGGTTSTVLSTRPVITAAVALPLNSLAAAGVDNLMVTMALPVAAGNTFQGLSSTINFAFTGTQRAGTAK